MNNESPLQNTAVTESANDDAAARLAARMMAEPLVHGYPIVRLGELNETLHRFFIDKDDTALVAAALESDLFDKASWGLITRTLVRMKRGALVIPLLAPLVGPGGLFQRNLSFHLTYANALLQEGLNKEAASHVRHLLSRDGFTTMPTDPRQRSLWDALRGLETSARSREYAPYGKGQGPYSQAAITAKDAAAQLVRDRQPSEAQAMLEPHVVEGGELYHDIQAQLFFARAAREVARKTLQVEPLKPMVARVEKLLAQDPGLFSYAKGDALKHLSEILRQCRCATIGNNVRFLHEPGFFAGDTLPPFIHRRAEP